MDATINAHLLKMRMGREVVVLAMLQHEEAIRSQKAVSKDKIG